MPHSPPECKLPRETWTLPFHSAGQKRLFIIAEDGSQQSMAAIALAAQLMHEYDDNCLVLHLGKEPGLPRRAEQLFAKCMPEMVTAGIPFQRCGTKYIQMQEGWSVADTLVYFANHADWCNAGAPVLVFGSAGPDSMGGAAASREPSRAATPRGGNSQFGDIAQQCVSFVKVPCYLVKDTGWRVSRTRVGRDATPGLRLAVCVDPSPVSKKAWDEALSCCRKGMDDELVAFHVDDASANGAESIAIKESYEAECAKLVCLGINARLVTVPSKLNLQRHILQFIRQERPDVMYMGSVELSNAKKKHHLGSVCLAVCHEASVHCVIVKNTL